MKFEALKKFALLFGAALFLFGTTSCNRGLGCPNNFSVDTEIVSDVVAPITKALIQE